LTVKAGGTHNDHCVSEDYQNYEEYITNQFVTLNIRELLLGYLRTVSTSIVMHRQMRWKYEW
jgi:hypothetical protein